ncbi:hypothetical protein Halru_1230 [Halovivax ruber XH-70]|uniref:Small CPxCG-related zinc finger protein n=2 Tax=Halovivax TaxID=332951 RepID=L0I8F1_HALRX|nr:hypothetical protein Halru_1230 [Halovivax ruber XH-70]
MSSTGTVTYPSRSHLTDRNHAALHDHRNRTAVDVIPVAKGDRSQGSDMPSTAEVRCPNDECFLDMFELHYTYDRPDDHDPATVSCPVCGETESLEQIEL